MTWQQYRKVSIKRAMALRLVEELGIGQDQARQIVAQVAQLPELRGAIVWEDPVIAFCGGILDYVWGLVERVHGNDTGQNQSEALQVALRTTVQPVQLMFSGGGP